MLTDTQRAIYRAWRKPAPWMRATPAGALFAARECRYPKQIVETSGHRGQNGKAVIQYWYCKASVPFRLVGYADELIRSIDHQGWYGDSFQDRTLRGIVFQLPARNGQTQYLYGYEESDSGSIVLYRDIETDESDAARSADGRAEWVAEESREYDEAWHAGAVASDKVQEALDNLRVEVRRWLACVHYEDRAGLLSQDDDDTQASGDELREELDDAIRDYRRAQSDWRGDNAEAFREGATVRTIPAIGRRITL